MGMVQNKGSINQCVVIHIYILEQRSYANDLKYPFKNGIMFLTLTTSHESKRIQAPKLAEPRNRDDNPSTAWDFAFLIPHHSTSFHIQGLCSSPRFHALSQRFRYSSLFLPGSITGSHMGQSPPIRAVRCSSFPRFGAEGLYEQTG
jgi:hypothetical protein